MDQRKFAPHTDRNKDPILDQLKELLAGRTRVLELASGSGQHAAYFANALRHLSWQPSDFDAGNLPSIDAWGESFPDAKILPALELDACAETWPVDKVDAIFNANMIHISPFEVCLGLLDGAARHLVSGGLLILYGPYQIGGEHTAESNAAFDENLKGRDPRWGVRNLEDVVDEATRRNLRFVKRIEMPANNQLLVFERD